MTLNVYSVVYNEEFMLPHFLKHYEQYADRIYIIDDQSTDRTAEIAKAHPKVTYIEYIRHRGPEFFEQDFNDVLRHQYKIHPSDWVIVADCDEFIQGLHKLGNLTKGILKTKGYMMIGKTGELNGCVPIRMKSFDKPVVFDASLDIKFGDGRHTVNLPTSDSNLELWHYKYPSREYYLQRSLDTYPRIMDAKDMSYRIKRGLKWYDDHIGAEGA